jgi:hypothetical protein
MFFGGVLGRRSFIMTRPPPPSLVHLRDDRQTAVIRVIAHAERIHLLFLPTTQNKKNNFVWGELNQNRKREKTNTPTLYIYTRLRK